MKCSLLTLSTFIDGELAPQRRAEVDAHLVGCTRCSAGAATLREEKTRVGQLARVTVDPGSAQLMLEQVGIVMDGASGRGPMAPPLPAPPLDAQLPWQAGGSSPALPWTPRRPESIPPVREEAGTPVVSPEVQPDLPLDGMRSAPASWDRARTESEASPAAEASGGHPSAALDAELIDVDEEWLSSGAAPDSWEDDLPPAADATPPLPVGPIAVASPGLVEPLAPAVPPPVAPSPPLPAPPQRLAAATGPAALWTRVRDAVTVRLALARGGDDIEDSAQIVSGAPSQRGAQLPVAAEPSAPDVVARAASPAYPRTAAPPEVELHGFAPSRPAPTVPEDHPPALAAPDTVSERRPRPPVQPLGEHDELDGIDGAGWNAFAASSYPDTGATIDRPPARPQRPLGRHSRAVAREQVPFSKRLSRGVAVMAAAVKGGTGAATAKFRQSVAGISKSGPDNRLLAGIAGIGLIFVIALLIGHTTSSHPSTPTATSTSTAPAVAPAHPSAAAHSSAAAAIAPAPVQTFGAGNTGFQVVRLRYGAQTGYMRVVFDLGAVSGAAKGTPKVTVSSSNPTTVLVTFSGTVPAGSTGTPTGKLISSVSLVSSNGHTSVYRFVLTRPATATAFYLFAPARFVLDLH